jgi:glycosyltransferase involved in cell wall biosynthesis
MNMAKSILILSFYFSPDLCAGSFRTNALIESLEPLAFAKNIQIDVVTTMPNRYANFQVDAPTYESKGCVTIHRIKIPTHQSGFFDQAKSFAYYFFKTLQITKHKEYDVIYATSSRLFTAFLGARIASKKRTPLFLDIRDIFTDTMKSILKFPLNILIPVFNFIERYTIKKANALNVVSEGFLPYFKNYTQRPISTISHGIDDCFKNMYCQKMAVDHLKKRILYAGNIGQGQGIEKIIPKLAEIFKNRCEFYIIGNGGQLKELKEASANLNNVHILSPMGRKELILHYQDCDILFLHLNDLPAFNKVLPSKIFEYAMTGKPILAGLSGYSADFLSQHVSGSWLFQPCNIIQATEQLNTILKNDLKIEDRKMFYDQFNREKSMMELSLKMMSYV